MSAAKYDATRSYPSPVANHYGPCDQPHVTAVCMAASSEEGVLRKYDIAANKHLVLVVKPDALSDPGAITDVQLPRKLDSGPRAEDDAITDLSAEQSQSTDTKGRANLPSVGD
ncbi:hypothetical protein [Cryobacterium arcticum]|uniref:hypothetical protein n=1 Tax=Cryobacterium arcticum TaxID=670052 RepID=UPI001F1E7BCB|nr:hypothetical protein [Cryobacterium arcticum]